LTSYADTGRILLERYDSEGRVSVSTVAYGEIGNVKIKNQDVVVIPDLRSLSDRAFVRVFNYGGRQGRVYIEDGETLGEFIPRFLRANEMNDLSRAVIERREEKGDVSYYRINLENKTGSGGAGLDFELRSGDVIAVPVMDVKVYVAGEVVEPGEVDYQHGLPAERYVALAGGPTRDGGFNNLSIYSSNGEKRSGKRNSIIYPGDTIVVERRTSKILGSAILSLASLTGLALSIIAVSRTN